MAPVGAEIGSDTGRATRRPSRGTASCQSMPLTGDPSASGKVGHQRHLADGAFFASSSRSAAERLRAEPRRFMPVLNLEVDRHAGRPTWRSNCSWSRRCMTRLSRCSATSSRSSAGVKPSAAGSAGGCRPRAGHRASARSSSAKPSAVSASAIGRVHQAVPVGVGLDHRPGARAGVRAVVLASR